MKIRPVGV